MRPATELSRPGKIAAIHALAEFYREHPDVPMPTKIVATLNDWPEAEDEGVAVQSVIQFAADFEITATQQDTTVSASFYLVDTPSFAINVTRRVYLVPAVQPRYVK